MDVEEEKKGNNSRKTILLTDIAWIDYYSHFYGHHKPYELFITDVETEEKWRKTCFGLLEYTEKIMEETGKVPIVVSSLDSSMAAHCFVADQLKKKGIRMLGSNILGFSICTYKLLTRKLVTGLETIKAVPIYSHEELIFDKGQAINGKVVCKPISESGSAYINVLDVSDPKNPAKNPFYKWPDEDRDFEMQSSIRKYMSKEEMKGIVGISEGYIDHERVYSVPCIDGYIEDGKIQDVAFTDSFYRKDNPQKYDFCICPSVLPLEEQQLCVDTFRKVCGCLYKDFGVNRQLVCVEMFLCKNQDDEYIVHVIEINLRNSMNNMATFLTAYANESGDFFELQKRLQTNQEISPVKLTGKTGVCLYRKTIENAPTLIKEGKYVYYNSKDVFGTCACHLFFEVDSIGNLERIKKEVEFADQWLKKIQEKFQI